MRFTGGLLMLMNRTLSLFVFGSTLMYADVDSISFAAMFALTAFATGGSDEPISDGGLARIRIDVLCMC